MRETKPKKTYIISCFGQTKLRLISWLVFVLVKKYKGSYISHSGLIKGFFGFVDDPSAGSPTETLLRLLLPLNDQV